MDGCLKELVAERDKKGISDSESMTARSRGLRLRSSGDKSEGIVPARQQLLRIDAAWQFPKGLFLLKIMV
ncbi:hypothetical protein NC653_003109 [Populus alba x Populus x berolinensis]|uniref:Uncharacterized protein n=1 Tax=Populus alba x Populus x berolinensis TaxID=444605 RepID=A0AAD6WK52_9ROSI|nr:hypothetical protein NC653_003109 [Populus alba x Populus x berolinensis]